MMQSLLWNIQYSHKAAATVADNNLCTLTSVTPGSFMCFCQRITLLLSCGPPAPAAFSTSGLTLEQTHFWSGLSPLPPCQHLSWWSRSWRKATEGWAAASAHSGSQWPTTYSASSSWWWGCLEGWSSTTCSSTRGPSSSSSAWSGGCSGTPGTSTCLPRSWRMTWAWWSWRTADWAGWWGACPAASPAGSGTLWDGAAGTTATL